MADITLRILGQEPLPLNLGSDNSETLSVGSGVTEGRLQEVLTDYVPKSDIDTTLSISGDVAESKTVGDLLMALFPTDSASGAIASFSDGADNVPVKSLSVTIEPKQSGSGTPAPDNVRPITGWDSVSVTRTGVNVWDGTSEEGYIDMNTGNELPNASQSRSLFVPIKPSTSYKFMNSNASTGVRMAFYDANKTFISNFMNGNANPQNFTTPTNAQYLRFYWGDITKVSINYPNTDSTYHEPKSNAYTIPLPSTVYGGILNVDSGVLTVTKVKHTVTSDDSTSLFQTGDNANRVGIPVSDAVAGTDAATRLLPICNISQASSTVPFSAETQALGYCALYNKVFLICVPTTATNVSAAKSWLVSQGCEFVYPLATPTTIPLTPTEIKTLLGDNNIFADSGDVSVVYSADIAKYIDKRLGA